MNYTLFKMAAPAPYPRFSPAQIKTRNCNPCVPCIVETASAPSAPPPPYSKCSTNQRINGGSDWNPFYTCIVDTASAPAALAVPPPYVSLEPSAPPASVEFLVSEIQRLTHENEKLNSQNKKLTSGWNIMSTIVHTNLENQKRVHSLEDDNDLLRQSNACLMTENSYLQSLLPLFSDEETYMETNTVVLSSKAYTNIPEYKLSIHL